jgi:hypothetical protein
MKKKLLLLFFLSSVSFANGQLFRRTYSWGSFNTLPSFAVSPEGGYALFGSYSGASTAMTGWVVIRTDSAGNTLWVKTLGGSGADVAADIIALPDSGWLLAGYSNSFSSNNDYDGYVTRLKASGDTLWTHTYGGTGWDRLNDALLLPDNTVLLTGSTYINNGATATGWSMVIDLQGNVAASNYVSSSNNLQFLKGALCSNDDILACGYSENPLTLERKAVIYRFNTSTTPWNTQWTYTSLGAEQEEIHGIAALPNGNIAFCGNKLDPGSTDYDFLIGAVTDSGQLLWREAFTVAGAEGYNDLFLRNDTIYACGLTASSGEGGTDFVINRFKSDGAFIQGCTIGTSENEIAFHGEYEGNGIFLVGGTTDFSPVGIQTMLLVRTDATDCSVTRSFVISVEESDLTSSVIAFPNPSDDLLRVELPEGRAKEKGMELILVSTDGRTVYREHVNGEQSTISVKSLPSGLYRLFVTGNGGSQSTRNMMILHADH